MVDYINELYEEKKEFGKVMCEMDFITDKIRLDLMRKSLENDK